jgi:hypothetical protein
VKPEQQHEATTPPTDDIVLPEEVIRANKPIFVRSLKAFYRNLPELLKRHEGKWAAYYGDECVGIARTQTELWERCLRRGLKEDEFVVLYVFTGALSDNDEDAWVTYDAEGRKFYRE